MKDEKNNIPAIKVKDLVVDYGESIAVNKINFEVMKGDLVTLLGPSGCGKSTTLNALAGLITTTSGKIYFNDKNVTKLSPKERKIGLVFQSYALYPHMTVYKNISFPLEVSDDLKKEIKLKNNEVNWEIFKYKFINSNKSEKEFKELESKIHTWENESKKLNDELALVKFKTKNVKKNAKDLENQARLRKEGNIKSVSKKTLSLINKNNDRIKKLKKEYLIFNDSNASDEDKSDSLKKLKLLINKIREKNDLLYKKYDKKIFEIKNKYLKEKEFAISEKKRILNEVKDWNLKETTRIKNEYKDISFKYEDEAKNATKIIKNIIKKFNSNDEQKRELDEINSKKLSYKYEIDKRVRDIAEKVGITDQLEKKVTKLSGGQQQRVAISRTLVKNPEILLMDEPLSNLDAKMRVSTREWIKSLQQELGITTIFVTHDQEEAMSISDKIICMSKGEIQQIDKPMDMYHNPTNKFIANFLGMPPMNLFKNNEYIHNELSRKFKLNNVSFGIRPEHIKIKEELKSSDKTIIDFDGVVELIESFGREKLLTININGESIKLFTEIVNIKIDDKIKISFKKNKLYLFSKNKKDLNSFVGRK